MTNKRYPDEFKIEAVRQITDRGHSVADVSKRLDVSTHSLYAWVKKFGPDAEANKSRNEEQAELKRLRKELQRVTEERDILKKAARTSRSSPTKVRLYQRAQGLLASTKAVPTSGSEP